jgi:hypothetical protein
VATAVAEPGRVPRLSRLLALAWRLDDLVQRHHVRDYALLARLGHVSRARITQVLNLLSLAPDIQEHILFLPPTLRGRDPIHLALVQPITRILDWRSQRRRWAALLRRYGPIPAGRIIFPQSAQNCLEVGRRQR